MSRDAIWGNFHGTSLAGAGLIGELLRRATAFGATFTDANVSRTNLTGAESRRARFTRKDVLGAGLADAERTRSTLHHLDGTFSNRQRAPVRVIDDGP